MTEYIRNWEDPNTIKLLKKAPRIVRHFNYSLKEENSYRCEFIAANTSSSLQARTRYIKGMMARAHGIQLGHLRIYFSSTMPVGFFHPDCGPKCLDNLWDRRTAYHLNRINRNNDERLSLEGFHTLLNKYLKQELCKDVKLFVPDIFDYTIRRKLLNADYITSNVW